MAEASGEARQRQSRAAGNACLPSGGKVAHAARIVLDFRNEIVSVALAAVEIQLEALWAKKMYLLKQIERKLAGHQLRAGLELYEIPVALRQVRRTHGLHAGEGLFNRVAVVYVERVAGDLAVKPRSGAPFATSVFFEQILDLVSYKQRFHGIKTSGLS